MTTLEYKTIPKSYLFTKEEAEMRELWARRFITEFTGVSRGLGYGVFHGGSLIRDIDFIAMPWRSGVAQDRKYPLTHVEYVLELVHCLPLTMGNHGDTLFGHKWYALWHKDHKDHQIDLKIVLPVPVTVNTEDEE
jgi:hypothetical protein